ncbi:ROK family protein [Candidatus Desulforudis audaxviator]|uniref:ROK family protein n=1 Tax=Desulforudis audaxviator (strain MP104C) TaxID=477974 RepID=B1I0X1_DESAP|nr:ROK family protein [Candidatus Desulforudis audaxviator]ACA58858.1 ROK family protein [Candidatus Desulforudis audaxviator MP104C]AZK58872.1 Mlc, transcriptional repressor of MalT (the transcriptional activator of maltose regulon) and manXYZ operon [Candidatus Desulforudis audaxviator]
MPGYVVGVDLGGTKIYTLLATVEGTVAAEAEVPTAAGRGYEAVLDQIADTVVAVAAQAGVKPENVRAVGVGAPGPLDPDTGIVHQAPNLGWKEAPLRADLEARLQLPVCLENDANLGALGEHTFGAGRDCNELVYVTVSTGIGGGLILRGEIYGGVGGGAGEIGHITVVPGGPGCRCGSRGCLEAVASGTAIALRARELLDKGAGAGAGILALAGGEAEAVTAATVARAAEAGDPEARAILDEAAWHLGTGLAAVVNLLNPCRIVLGGGVMKSGRLLWDRMDRSLREQALDAAYRRVRLVPGALGARAGALGAVTLALRSR